MPAENLIKSFSFQVLHRDVLDPVGFAQVEDADYIPVGNLSREDELLFEALQNFGIAGQLRPNHFQGNDPIELHVPGLIHRSHTALAEDLDQAVAVANNGSRLK